MENVQKYIQFLFHNLFHYHGRISFIRFIMKYEKFELHLSKMTKIIFINVSIMFKNKSWITKM